MVRASYFDGRSTRVHPVSLSVLDDDLVIAGEDTDLRVPFADVKVDERLGRAPRRLRLPDGTFCEVRDLEALDALLSTMSHHDSRVDRMQRGLSSVLLSCVASIALTLVAYKVGLPWAAEWGARRLPPSVGKTLSVQTLKALDGAILGPTHIEPQRQQALTSGLRALRLPDGGHPASKLLFRNSPQLGANAFTLPDGTIILLDGLIDSVGDDQHVLAVVAHELGHAHGRHGLQLLLRTSAVGAFLSFYVGDISHLLAAAPAAVVQAHYSQDLEREADDYAADLLAQNGLSPGLLADDLQKLSAAHPGASGGGYLASHPPTAERIQRLRSHPGAVAAHPQT